MYLKYTISKGNLTFPSSNVGFEKIETSRVENLKNIWENIVSTTAEISEIYFTIEIVAK